MAKYAVCPAKGTSTPFCCSKCHGKARSDQSGTGTCYASGGLYGCDGTGHGQDCPLYKR